MKKYSIHEVRNGRGFRSIFAVAMGLVMSVSSIARAEFVTHKEYMGKEVWTLNQRKVINPSTPYNAGRHILGYQGEDYVGWCIEPTASSTTGWRTPYSYITYDTPSSHASTPMHEGRLVAYLLDTYALGVDSASDPAAEAAALQLAVWEIMKDEPDSVSDYGLAVGDWQAKSPSSHANTAAARIRGDQMLNAMKAASSTWGGDGYETDSTVVFLEGTGQDYVIYAIPEPATAGVMLIAGFACLCWRRWFLRRS